MVVNPFLSSNANWYFAADPRAATSLARILLVGSDPSGIGVTFGGNASWVDAAGRHHAIPGIAVDMVHTSAIESVSPVGLVRLAKT